MKRPYVIKNQIQTQWYGFLRWALLSDIDFFLVMKSIRKCLEPIYEVTHHAKQ